MWRETQNQVSGALSLWCSDLSAHQMGMKFGVNSWICIALHAWPFTIMFSLDLFKSLVVLQIVNTVNELIHLRHIIYQNPLYVPICP